MSAITMPSDLFPSTVAQNVDGVDAPLVRAVVDQAFGEFRFIQKGPLHYDSFHIGSRK